MPEGATLVLGELIVRDMGARLIRMTPTIVIEERAKNWDPFIRQGLSWRSAEVADLAERLVKVDPNTVDLHRAFTPDAEEWITADGVHPTVTGQQQILRALVNHFQFD